MDIRKTILELFNGVPAEDYAEEIEELHTEVYKLGTSARTFKKELTKIEQKRFPHNSILVMLEHGTDFKPIRRYYKAWQDGKEKNRQWHNYLKLSKDTADRYLQLFNKITRNKKYKTADDLVYDFCGKFESKIPIKYKLDKYNSRFGKHEEYIESPKELIDEYDKYGNLYADCDSVGIFMYTLLFQGLQEQFPEYTWRLRNNIVLFYGVNPQPYKHWNLSWLRGGKLNDWVFIETTLQKERRLRNWNNPIRLQNNYNVELCFDYFGTYRGLNK